MLLRTLGLLTLFLCLSCAEQRRYTPDWPTLHGNAQRSRSVEYGPRPPLQESWVFEAKGRLVYPPSVADGVVYVGARDGTLTALKLEDGAQLWQNTLEQGGLFSSPSVDQGVVFAGKWVPYYFVYAYEAATGKTLWSVRSGELENRPPWVLVDAEHIYTHGDPPIGAPREQGAVVQAWQREDQREVWKQPVDGLPRVAPALSEELLLYATDAKRLYAMERQTGSLRWQIELSSAPASAPLVHEGKAFIATRNGFLYAVELATGKLAWRFQFPERSLTGDLAIADNLLLVPSKNYLLSFNIKSLEAGWTFRAPRDITAPLISKEQVYFGCENQLFYVLDREKGFLRASYRTGGAIYAAPITADGRLLVASSDGKLYTYIERPVERKRAQPSPHPFNNRL